MRTSISRVVSTALSCVSVAAVAAAQGSNDCATATPISGLGTFAVNTTTATDSAQQSGTCPTAHRDVWFAWTATATNPVSIDTCGGVGVDSVIAVYSGSTCPAPAALLACNDDSCGLQSLVTINSVSGTTYMVQLGGFGAATTYSGTFTIAVSTPPPACGTNTGPDVVVGGVIDVLNVTASGGIDAVALGTDACNLGTALANWIQNTPAHPVIRQNVYRYKVISGAGRLEHIGLSWLKNSFAAAQSNTCCTCQPGGDGSHLGVGCSDAYGAGLNGAQSNAEPNHLVNAHTGVFTYPPPNPAFSGQLARRCQMQTSELEATGGVGAARYFGECHYVTADDAAAGNQNNNASWREMTVTGSGDFTLGLTGSTHREESAIRIWSAMESGVTINPVQVTGDGLVLVGSKATSLGGGQWHYEYAVQNMNSDRNVGSFSVPVPAGATVTNIGFHDVNYHSGDGNGYVTFSGTDWVGTLSGGAITWACETQAVNNNANAIRWSSTYNFRFDTNTPPQSGTLTFGMWKPGAPGFMTTNGDVPTGNSAFTSYCFGDGTGLACPCANSGTSGNGCANSTFSAGANLNASGNASVASDSVVLSASNMTGAIAIFFQGGSQLPASVVDDGIGCVGGPIIRLGNNTVGGAGAIYPDVGDTSVSVRGAIPGAGGTLFYQCFYRNSVAAFCPPATSNRTNGVQIVWAP